jgi:hypothetical protein
MMREEHNIGEFNHRKNPYARSENIEHLTKLINDAMVDARFTSEQYKPARIAAYLIKNGVQLHNNPNTISLPRPIGTTLYRIDRYSKTCSYHHENRECNLYYCVNDWKCRHLCAGMCDAGFEYKLYTIKNADAMTILGNAELFGTDRLFFDKEDAEQALAKKQAEEIELRKQRGKELMPSYEGYREYWDDECEDDDDE